MVATQLIIMYEQHETGTSRLSGGSAGMPPGAGSVCQFCCSHAASTYRGSFSSSAYDHVYAVFLRVGPTVRQRTGRFRLCVRTRQAHSAGAAVLKFGTKTVAVTPARAYRQGGKCEPQIWQAASWGATDRRMWRKAIRGLTARQRVVIQFLITYRGAVAQSLLLSDVEIEKGAVLFFGCD